MSKPKVNENGLVDCKILQAFGRYNPGMNMAGFPQDEAVYLKSKGAVDYEVEGDPKPAATSDDVVTIPPDWRESHHLTIIALAKKIMAGSAPAEMTKDQAIFVIENALKAEGA